MNLPRAIPHADDVCRHEQQCGQPNEPTKPCTLGSVYPEPESGEEIRKSVQIMYCRANFAEDFAYCLLSEKPNILPIPIAVPCEVDAEMTEDTPVIAVGSGRCIGNNASSIGTKRWAMAELESDLLSTWTISS